MERFARAGIVIAAFFVALPLGAFLGAFTVSGFTNNLATGLLMLTGSVTTIAVIGFGLYIIAEGEIPAFLDRHLTAR